MPLTRKILPVVLALLSLPVLAQHSKAELLSEISRKENVGTEVTAALARTGSVRVFVAMRQGEVTREPANQRQAISQARSDVLSSLGRGDFELKRQFDNVSGFAGYANPQAVAALANHPLVWRVDIDVGGSGNLSQSLALSNFAARRNQGYSGEGVTVAVVDSGYDSDHPDLADSLVREQCFCSGGSCCPNGSATQSGAGAAEDDHGHGTHVAGIITSNGTEAPTGGAPDADIVAIKVLDDNNSFCCVSDVIAALDWIISSAPEVDLVNMSLGTNVRYAGDCDAVSSWTRDLGGAIDTLKARGVPVFVSSGNNGSGVDMQAPACIANAISVGAVWDSNVGTRTHFGCTDQSTAADKVTCWSNSSTTTDVFAPGALVTSTRRGGESTTFVGTSQASPIVTACAALLLEESPNLTPTDLETMLKRSDVMVTDATNGLSFPRLDCATTLLGFFTDGFEGD